MQCSPAARRAEPSRNDNPIPSSTKNETFVQVTFTVSVMTSPSDIESRDTVPHRGVEVKEHSPPGGMGPLLSLFRSRKASVAGGVIALLMLWTCVLAAFAHYSGWASSSLGSASAPPTRRAPLGLGLRQRGAAGSASSGLATADGEHDQQLDRRWTDKLLSDLQSSASDESVAATVAELRDTISERDERLAALEGAARRGDAVARAAGGGGGASAAEAMPNVPRYDPKSLPDLKRAAMATVLPANVKGAVPQLVRDMASALESQVRAARRAHAPPSHPPSHRPHTPSSAARDPRRAPHR